MSQDHANPLPFLQTRKLAPTGTRLRSTSSLQPTSAAPRQEPRLWETPRTPVARKEPRIPETQRTPPARREPCLRKTPWKPAARREPRVWPRGKPCGMPRMVPCLRVRYAHLLSEDGLAPAEWTGSPIVHQKWEGGRKKPGIVGREGVPLRLHPVLDRVL